MRPVTLPLFETVMLAVPTSVVPSNTSVAYDPPAARYGFRTDTVAAWETPHWLETTYWNVSSTKKSFPGV
jgi:hypothetical protein